MPFTVDAKLGNSDRNESKLSSIQSPCVVLIPEGGLDDADNSDSRIDNPTSLPTITNRNLFEIIAGTTLLLRMRYRTTTTFTTAPVIQVFGTDDMESWSRLWNENGVHQITISASVTDLSDGTNKFTDVVKLSGNVFLDTLGSLYGVVGVMTAAAGTNVNLCRLEGRMI